ncbi:glycosyltransferase [Methanobrevibacter sp. DSM 116169]|uniref:glycosyltransferase n=1 Tax=Methanobrevibacter sp. DSM 116169 TaxID=3242727 RepID=UPI0038FD3888
MSWILVLLLMLIFSLKPKKTNDNQTISVIIPAYNEEENIANVIDVIKKIDYITEIIVVNDGSNDNTETVAKRAGATVVSHEKNLGKGAAIKTGFKQSDSDIIAFIDGDIYNLTTDKIEAMIKPILEGKTEITKTKFVRESGRVTELTAKPLLRVFFPEINFEQPLSGQFAAKKSALKKMKFEKDYGVDVGIVLDADIQGLSILEVDIGEIEHDISPLKDLNLMANEVVRTIINRAMEYGRVAIIDTMGSYIRMAVLGLSLVILGLFAIFFVQKVPLEIGAIVSIIGLIIAIYYLIKLFIKSVKIFKKTPSKNLIKSFISIHFPVIISGIILILMISTFLGATTVNNGSISVEPTSRNLMITTDEEKPISVRGPYTVDAALENELNIIRMPPSALTTLGLSYGDVVQINNKDYIINETRPGEENIIRMPLDVQEYLNVDYGNIIQNSRINQVFEGTVVNHFFNSSGLENTTLSEDYIISSKRINGTSFEIFLDNKSIGSSSGVFENNSQYIVTANDEIIGTLDFENSTFKNDSYVFYYNDHIIELKFKYSNTASIKQFLSNNQGSFLQFRF